MVPLQISEMFLPERSKETLESEMRSSSERCFAYLLKIAMRESSSGFSNLILISIRESIAGSRSYFLFVAQTSSTSEVLSKLSIFLSSVERILLEASCISESV